MNMARHYGFTDKVHPFGFTQDRHQLRHQNTAWAGEGKGLIYKMSDMKAERLLLRSAK